MKRRLSSIFAAAIAIASLLVLFADMVPAATVTVTVGDGGFSFNPASVTIHPGDSVLWTWSSNGHSSTSGSPAKPTALWDSGLINRGTTFTHTFPNAGSFPYYCTAHGACCHMVGTVTVSNPTPTPTPTPATAAIQNISTRAQVLTVGNVLIGGFVISGTGTKDVLVRGLGPTLGDFGITGFLADPTLDLRNSNQAQIATNDNWQDTQQAAIQATGKAPPHASESAILRSGLAPGNYTAIVSGKNNTTGVGLVEIYDQSPASTAHLTNISSRGMVGSNTAAMIVGFITGVADNRVIVRVLGPTLSQLGVTGVLSDPVLQLFDANGNAIASNDNWPQSPQVTEIQNSGFAPPNAAEPAVISIRPIGNTTAVVSGKNGTTGVALVEVYKLP